MLTRENALNTWLNSLINNRPHEFTPLAGDASFRRYFRLRQGNTTRIIMDAPPEQEGLAPFISIARTLAEAGVRTPDIIAFDLKQGFALLEDFGDILLFDTLTSNTTHQHYERALDTLHKIQQCTVHQPKLASFNQEVMHQELLLFRTWFLD
ncbi:MAG: phosphotransferase, partial [Gammaproteobacteria bacterium]|nr:phosphotransferase [Gammaproteobacteria bacterium]